MDRLLLLTWPDRAEFHNTVAVLTPLGFINILFSLHTLGKLTHVEELRVLHVKVLKDVSPFETCERWLTFRLISKNEPALRVFTML